jgi:DNA-binding SARP family transcriptional activator/TolB-like protein/tetratricopeptide (TPR) repeat protein
MLEIRLLGPLDVVRCGVQGPTADAVQRQPKRLALLAYLCLAGRGGAVRRDTVLAAFWPELDQSRARAALRQALHYLRQHLGEGVIEARGDDLLVPPAHCRVDAVAFDEALAAERWTDAAALYRGPLLDGLHVAGAGDAFEQWLLNERARLHDGVRLAVDEIGRAAEAAGDAAGAVHWARRAVELDPLREAPVRRLMRLLDRAGDAGMVGAVYAALERRLLDERGTAPSADTAALAATLRPAAPAQPAPSISTIARDENAPARERAHHAAAPAAAQSSEPPRAASPRRALRRVVFAAAAGAGVMAVAAAVAVGFTPQGSRAIALTLLTRGSTGIDPRRVVVAPLESRTQDARLDAFGEMAADWITQSLGRTGEFEVVDARTAALTARVVDRIPRVLRPGDRAVALARETGAGMVVSGRYYVERDTVRVYVQLTDVATGRVRRAFGPVAGPAAVLSTLVDRVSRGVAAHAAAAVDTSAAGLSVGHSAPPSYEAYREMNRAWRRYYATDFPSALDHAARAAALDSTYMLPLLVGAFFRAELRQWAAVDSLVRRVAPYEDRLAPLDAAAFAMIRADLAGDHAAVLWAAQELQRLNPTSAEARTHVAHQAVVVNRPRLALEALAPLDATRGVLLVVPWYWTWRAAALHELGNHTAELAATERQLGQFPTRTVSLLNRARALAAVGRADDVRRLAERATDDRWPAEAVRRRALVEGSRELRAHGHGASARALLAGALAAPPADDSSLAAAEERALLLAEAERWSEARALLEGVLGRAPGRATARGALGVVAARQGDRAEAQRAQAVLAAPVPFALGRRTMWRARIASALGDRARAVALVQQALGEGYPVLQGYAGLPGRSPRFDYAEPSVHADPALASLADDPAFQRVVAPRP